MMHEHDINEQNNYFVEIRLKKSMILWYSACLEKSDLKRRKERELKLKQEWIWSVGKMRQVCFLRLDSIPFYLHLV